MIAMLMALETFNDRSLIVIDLLASFQITECGLLLVMLSLDSYLCKLTIKFLSLRAFQYHQYSRYKMYILKVNVDQIIKWIYRWLLKS